MNDIQITCKEEETIQELEWLRLCSERSAAKIMELNRQSIAIRHELEHKRRGFHLLADLAATLRRDSDYASVFVSVARRINAALNMQRTVVLEPEPDGSFRASVLQGYPHDLESSIESRIVKVDIEFFDSANPVLVTGADSPDRFADVREALDLPFFVSAPIVVNHRIAGILITGRVVEQVPFLTRLGSSDVETVRTIASHLAAVLAEQRLAEAENRMRIMFDATPLCCNFWNEEYRNIDCNQEAVRLFQLLNKQEYLDRFDELSPEFQPDGRRSYECSKEKLREAFETGYAKFEWMHSKLNGEPMPSEITLVRVKRGDSYIVAGYTRDLREQKAMLAAMHKKESELRVARDIAERSAKAKSEFLANMSHEIRTPMNAVLGMMHILGESELTARQRDYLNKAANSANMLMRIINDILDFSKIDAGKLEIENVRFSPRELMDNVRNIIGEMAEKKGLSLDIDIAPNVPEDLVGDPLRLMQVVLNIANNAVKFTRNGGVEIKVTLGGEDDNCTAGLFFEISDTGIGLTPEQLEGLFAPFSQADTSTTRKYGGTGLGLAISRSLVELMGGEIRCESEQDRGSKFSFYVKLDVPSGESDSSCDQETNSSPENFEDLRGMKVLLAEDNEINQMIAIELLAVKGVKVTAVPNGLQALEAIDGKDFDLVLMDIQMPEMDGLTATKKIRADSKHANLPIIAMTAHAMIGDREISLEAGMNDHITKPIVPRALYETLKRWGKRAQVSITEPVSRG